MPQKIAAISFYLVIDNDGAGAGFFELGEVFAACQECEHSRGGCFNSVYPYDFEIRITLELAFQPFGNFCQTHERPYYNTFDPRDGKKPLGKNWFVFSSRNSLISCAVPSDKA